MICKGFGGGWLPTSQAPFCKEHGPGQRVWAELVLQPSLPCARQCFGTGTTCRKSPSHSLKMQQGNSLEERGMRHRLQKQRQAKSKAKNKCLLMHWAWPVTPITWFSWLLSIFKRDCFPRRMTPCWLGYRPPCEATGAPHDPSSAYKLSWPLGLDLLNLSWGWVQCSLMPPSASTGKKASGSHKNLDMQKCPKTLSLVTCLAPRLLLADTCVASQCSVMLL